MSAYTSGSDWAIGRERCTGKKKGEGAWFDWHRQPLSRASTIIGPVEDRSPCTTPVRISGALCWLSIAPCATCRTQRWEEAGDRIWCRNAFSHNQAWQGIRRHVWYMLFKTSHTFSTHVQWHKSQPHQASFCRTSIKQAKHVNLTVFLTWLGVPFSLHNSSSISLTYLHWHTLTHTGLNGFGGPLIHIVMALQ